MGDAGITQEEMIREVYKVVCISTPSKPSLCGRMTQVENWQAGHDARQRPQTGWNRFLDSAIAGAGGAAGAIIIASIVLGLAVKFNTEAAQTRIRQEVTRAAP